MELHAPPWLTDLTVRRTMDTAYVNALANDPDVRPTLGGAGPLDCVSIVEDPAQVAFRGVAGGAILCQAIGAGRYDAHTLFRPDERGVAAFAAMRDATDYMFARTDCTDVRTLVPEMHPGARVAARRTGFLELFACQIPWTHDTRIPAVCYSLTLDRWALVISTRTPTIGAWFHAELEARKRRLTAHPPAHPPDPTHDRAVGAACLMIHGGQVAKGVAFYNTWAACARYAPITVLRTHPIILDIQDAILEVDADRLEVLRCHRG